MATSLKKINPECSGIDLIDSSSCVGDSLETINNNFDILSKKTANLLNNIITVNQQLTMFQQVSSNMINIMYNNKIINDVYSSPYTIVKKLSANWSYKEFTIYFPNIVDLVSYNSNKTFYNQTFIYYLYSYFDPSVFAEGQVINFFVTLSYNNIFSFQFKGNYSEICAPTAHSDANISCDGCQAKDSRRAGCNHDRGHRHWCDNAYQYCKTEQIKASDVYSCRGHVADTFEYDTNNGLYQTNSHGYLNIDYQLQNIEDRFIARVISFKLQNKIDVNGSLQWEVI